MGGINAGPLPVSGQLFSCVPPKKIFPAHCRLFVPSDVQRCTGGSTLPSGSGRRDKILPGFLAPECATVLLHPSGNGGMRNATDKQVSVQFGGGLRRFFARAAEPEHGEGGGGIGGSCLNAGRPGGQRGHGRENRPDCLGDVHRNGGFWGGESQFAVF